MGFCRYFTIALAASCSVNVLGQTVQKPNLKVPRFAEKNRTAVVKIFTESYSAYKFVLTFASMHLLISYAENSLSVTTT
jgi:hypothetical protein